MKCQCLQDDEQSDPANTTEQFCGYEKDGYTYGCTDSKGCGQCSDKDPKKCNNGCPVLNQPVKSSSDGTVKPRGDRPSKKSDSKKDSKPSKKSDSTVVSTVHHHHTTKKKTNWWLWIIISVVVLLIVGGAIAIIGNSSQNSMNG